jgi:hypothetical protein
MKQKIIMVSGKIGSGKDFVADILVNEFNFHKITFSYKLKEAAAVIGGFSIKDCYIREGKDKPVPMIPQYTIGEFLQDLGTEVGKTIDPYIWSNHVIKYIKEHPQNDFVVPDLRFPDEGQNLLESFPDAKIFYLDREDVDLLGSRDPNHASEQTQKVLEHFEGQSCFFNLENHGKPAEQTADDVRNLMKTLYKEEK